MDAADAGAPAGVPGIALGLTCEAALSGACADRFGPALRREIGGVVIPETVENLTRDRPRTNWRARRTVAPRTSGRCRLSNIARASGVRSAGIIGMGSFRLEACREQTTDILGTEGPRDRSTGCGHDLLPREAEFVDEDPSLS